MTYSREILRHDLKAKSQIARSFNLQPVDPSPVQMGLGLRVEPTADEYDAPTCDHSITEPQINLFDGTDEVCVECGARV